MCNENGTLSEEKCLPPTMYDIERVGNLALRFCFLQQYSIFLWIVRIEVSNEMNCGLPGMQRHRIGESSPGDGFCASV